MKEIVSKNIPKKWKDRRNRDKKKLVNYWSNIFPSSYAKDMIKDYASVEDCLKKLASDARASIFKGPLRQTEDGFVFVDIPNSVFNGFIPLLEGAEKPPFNENHYNDIGAHISVIKKQEAEDNNIKIEHEIEVPFTIGGIEEVEDPDGWDEMEKVWFLKVDAPELEKIRKSYGLSPRIEDHDFHITVGVKKRIIPGE